MGRNFFLVLCFLIVLWILPANARRQRAVPKRYASASGKDQKPKVKKSLIDADKRATAVGAPKSEKQIERVAIEVDATGELKQYAPVAQTVDGGTGTNDNIDIESAVRRELERTTNGVESLEATRFFEDIVESQRKQEETMKRMLEEMRRMRSEIERMVEQRLTVA